jgi:hypothetical protein
MSDKVTKALLEELSLLRVKLEQTDIYKEIQILERMIARRQSMSDGATGDDRTVTTFVSNASASLRTTPIPQVKSRVAALLSDAKSPIPTKEIHAKLSSEGISVPGKHPQSNLSAHLSRDETFTSWGRSGWTLATAIEPDVESVENGVSDYIANIGDEERQILYECCITRGEGAPEQVEKNIATQIESQLGRNLVAREQEALRSSLHEHLKERAKSNSDDVLGDLL